MTCLNLPREEFSSEPITQHYFTETITKSFYKKQAAQKHNLLFSKIMTSYYTALSTCSTYILNATKIPSTGGSKIYYLSKNKIQCIFPKLRPQFCRTMALLYHL